MQSEFLLRRSRGLEAAISGPQLARASHVCGCSTFARPGQLAPGERESNIRVPVFAFVSAQGAYSPHVRTSRSVEPNSHAAPKASAARRAVTLTGDLPHSSALTPHAPMKLMSDVLAALASGAVSKRSCVASSQ